MNYVREYIFAFVVTFEFLSILSAAWFGFYWQKPLLHVGDLLGPSTDILKYLAFVPVGLAVWNIGESRKLLFPDHGKKQILHEWPEYWKLRIRFSVAFIYSCLFALSGVSTWLFGFSHKNPAHFSMILFSILGAVSVSITVYWARINEEEALIKIKEH